MIKTILTLLIINLVLVLVCLGLGVYEAFIINLWFGVILIISLIVALAMLTVFILKFFNLIVEWAKKTINKLPKWLRKLLKL